MLKSMIPTPTEWDAFVQHQPRAHTLQLSAWGELKHAYGWQVVRVALQDEAGVIVAGAQVLLKMLPFHFSTMGYIPMGPYVTDDLQYPALWDALRRHLIRHHRTAFIKIEPGIFTPGETVPDWSQWGFTESPQTIQPPRTVLIDITGSEEAILARMNQGTRRKIRQSIDKNGIRYYEGSRADVAKFNALMQTTGDRNEFGVHEPAYYERAYDLFVPGHATLLLAEHEGDTLAGIMVFATGQTACYLYGASSNDKRNLMASYGIQWQAIQWARARGCTTYDLWGIPDEDEATLEAQFQTRSDGLWGVYGFKRGWGGQVVRSQGTWDCGYIPLFYQAYKLALRYRDRRVDTEG
ncbi:MAG TPA: peptidoglycan bridge formation glycyltransferase FemA/FemB family protein [Phototrophicaceae bacterium]|nr:peptidoglycan bridge formation glycyltransferase FemA/FemB family protein [Phototrophicaceae bacterium]